MKNKTVLMTLATLAVVVLGIAGIGGCVLKHTFPTVSGQLFCHR